MKKLITILAIILLVSCSQDNMYISPDRYPMTITASEATDTTLDKFPKYVYTVRTNYAVGDRIYFYSDSVYNIGDTIHFLNKKNIIP